MINFCDKVLIYDDEAVDFELFASDTVSIATSTLTLYKKETHMNSHVSLLWLYRYKEQQSVMCKGEQIPNIESIHVSTLKQNCSILKYLIGYYV
jgi:hypothetical protein